MKKILIGICSVAAAGAILTGTMSCTATVSQKNSIGSTKALEIALSDAGVKKEKALNTSSEFDKENGRYVFDVDFSFNGKEYDYTIDAKSGEIIERDVEAEKKSTTTTTTTTTSKRISLEKAKKAALTDANVSSSKATFTKAKLEKDDGVYEYEIEFTAGNKEYEYTIDAYTGKVLEKDVETKKTTTTTTTSKRISLEKAKKAALTDANVSSSKATFTKAKLEKDDGVYEYEIEFTSGNKEYEYTIDAYTGKVLEKEVETKKTTTTTTTSKRISLEKAKKAALTDANVSSSKATFTKAKLEKDDGVYEYEIEFTSGNKEYEYTIDAYTGKVLEKDVETKKTTTTTTTAKRISLEKAKKAALTDANVSSSKATFTKAKLEKDDGVYEYEIEFTAGNKEYEYTIDAYTGKVLEKDVETKKTTTTTTTSKRISLEKAKKAALTDANVSSSKATFTKAKLEKDDGVYEYEIEFTSGNKEYEYTIDAYTGKVLEKDVETKKTTTTTTTSKRISLEKAKKAALTDANVSSSKATFTKAKLEKDDGVYEYEIEFTAGNKEYEYTIDAYTGKVLEKEVEVVPSASSLISVDKARSVALKHAGLNLNEVSIEKVKLEKDDGKYEYEVEFTKGNWEYEYTIDAKTGKILDFEKEYDD